jgi:alkylhydroperoxidase family enzyme
MGCARRDAYGCWQTARDRLLIATADALHDTADVPDELWAALSVTFDEPQLLDLLLLAGWYHAISYVASATRLPPEPHTPAFASLTAS